MDSFSSLLGVGSLNFSNSPDREAQSTQGKSRQRKRPRNGIGTPPMSMPSPESVLPSSSRPNEVGSSSQVPPPKIVYKAWTDATQAQLFEWLELPGNYNKWKCAGIRSSNGSTRSSALTKKTVTIIVSAYLDTLNTKKSLDQVMSKMRYVEKNFKEAEDFLRNTGEGLTSNDEKLGITKIREKVISICLFYFQVKSFMSETVSINPPYNGETGVEENIQDVLFGSSTAALASGCAHKGEPYENEDDENSSSDEETPFDDDITREQEPLEENISEGVPAQRESTQSQSTRSKQPKERKRKPKSFQESVQDIGEQNRVLMEKKFAMQGAHQAKKLLFLREESKDKLEFIRHELQQKYSLESRRLDLGYMKIEHESQQARNKELTLQVQLDQQRQEARNRELALQLELEKLRCNS